MTGIRLDSPVTAVLGGSGSKKDRDRREALAKLGVETVRDLLAHFPRRYLETGTLTRVADLREGQVLTVVGEIATSKLHDYLDRRTHRTAYRVETVLRTDGPSLQMTFFAKRKGVAHWQRDRFPPGASGVFTGRVSRFRGAWQLANPEAVLFGREGVPEDPAAEYLDAARGLYPLYPLSGPLTNSDLLRVVGFAMTVLEEIPEPLPEPLRTAHDLVDVSTALRWVHTPDDWGQVKAGQRRFRFEEALITQLVLARRRAALRSEGAQPRTGGGGLLAAFDARLPFALTPGQQEVGTTIAADLAEPHPMNRLLQGEVGSGKTLVALRAMLRVVDSGGQTALLAPTEVLAQQHHRSITAMLGDLAAGGMLGAAEESTRVVLLTGSMSKAQRTEALAAASSGEAGIVIGTHALLEERVRFSDLGLVVVDEQHRFGVEQRATLTDKAGSPPHLLVMTATPIPRTVAMTVFGDLEVSTLRELPAGRAPIETHLVALGEHPGWIDRVWGRVREEVERGRQVYVVCPRIGGDIAEEGQVDPVEESDDEGPAPAVREGSLAAVEELLPELADGPLAGLRLAMLHGRLPAEEKDGGMRAFAAGEIDVLVSTTVIEVGVDVGNASTMVLLDADRFGVSQLHQLRGRVGRGGLPGLCLLVTHAAEDSPALERLTAVAATTDGFELSRVDLAQRREGDVLGARQSGFHSGLQRLRVLRDEDTIVEAREAGRVLLADDPELSTAPLLRAAVDELERDRKSAFMERS